MKTTPRDVDKKLGALNILIIATTLIIGGIFFYYRINFLNAPVGNDESVYLYLGKLAFEGGAPYKDFYEMKPPMLFYSYGITGALTGFSLLGLHINAILIVLLTAFLIFKTFSRKYERMPTLLACTLWALFYSSPLIYGNYLQSEHFVALYLSLVFYIILFRSPTNWQLFLSGTFYGAAILTKQSAIFFALPGLILLYELGFSWKERFAKLAIFGAGVLSIALFFLLVILAFGSFGDMMYWLIEFPAGYVGRIKWEVGKTYLAMFGEQIFKFNAYFFSLAFLALIYTFVDYRKRINWFYILCVFFGFASIFPGMRFYGQYWLLFVFPMSFVLIPLFDAAYAKKWAIGFFTGILLLVFAQGTSAGKVYFAQNVDKQINEISYGQYFDKTKKMGEYLQKILKKEDTFMVLGAVSQLYVYTNKVAPTRHVWNTMLNVKTSKNKIYQDEYLNDLERVKPNYIFYSFSPLHWNLRSSNSDYVYNKCFDFVSNNYIRVAIMDLKTGELFTDDAARRVQVKPETYVIYKRR